jgi:double-stranded uracil-DNA glycosylase
MGFTRAQLEAARGRSLPDLVGPRTRLLFVGINPGLRSAAVGAHFGGGSNRFFPALHLAGILDRRIDASSSLASADRAHLLERGIGITSLVPGASARADELSREQLIAGAAALRERVELIRPTLVAFLGITAFRVAFAAPHAHAGPQPTPIAGAALWVVPNPSGLNRGTTLGGLAAAYREAAVAGGHVAVAAPAADSPPAPPGREADGVQMDM